jgi:predicted DNA-binding protein with PD1-like motif
MEHFVSLQVGRTFILRMERGDYLRETLIEFAKNEKIANAVIVSGIATFDEANFQMSTTYGFPMEYHVEHLNEPLELTNLDGTIINSEPHLHGTISNAHKTWAGHILDGCKILYLGEIVVQELLGNKLKRMPDKDGVMLISEVEKK